MLLSDPMGRLSRVGFIEVGDCCMSMVFRTSLLILVATLLGALAACGPVRSTVVLIQADQALKEARTLGAEESAPFPTALAAELIEKAREEQGYSSYDTATQFAEEAKKLAEDAVKLAREAAPVEEEPAPEEGEPGTEAPIEQEPAAEEPTAEETVAEEPAAEETAAEETAAEETAAEEPAAGEPAAEEPAAEEPAP